MLSLKRPVRDAAQHAALLDVVTLAYGHRLAAETLLATRLKSTPLALSRSEAWHRQFESVIHAELEHHDSGSRRSHPKGEGCVFGPNDPGDRPYKSEQLAMLAGYLAGNGDIEAIQKAAGRKAPYLERDGFHKAIQAPIRIALRQAFSRQGRSTFHLARYEGNRRGALRK